MDTTSRSSRRWFSGKWEREISGIGEIPNSQASEIVDTILRRILPRALFDERLITDLKGRDSGRVLLDTFPEGDHPTGDEILYISGYAGARENVLTYRLTSSFEAFEGSHISNSLQETRSHSVPLFLSPLFLGYIAPLTLTHFRLGFEIFQNTRMPLSFGYTPTVTDRMLLDYHEKTVAILIMSDALPSRDAMPFSKTGEAEALLKLLKA